MYAIIRQGGKQFRITENSRIKVPEMEAAVGDEVVFDDVILVSSKGETHVGRPTVKGASVRAEVIQHGLEDKIVVFKFKRRKSERRKAGHRQGFTEVVIKEIRLHPSGESTEQDSSEKSSTEDDSTA